MPTVAIIEGVKIQFYPREHLPAHFHAVFAEHRVQIEIASLRVLRVVISWAETRREELQQAWDAMTAKRKPEKIP